MANNRLTWQNVAAPDFSGVTDSYRLMNQLLSNATKSGSDMISGYTNAHAAAADRAIQQRMMAVQNAAQYDPNAILGPDAARASMGMMKNVEQYQDELMSRDATRVANGQTVKDFDWKNTGRDQIVANAEAINAAQTLGFKGSAAGLQDPRLANLRPDVLADVGVDVGRAYQQGRGYRSDGFTDEAAAAAAEIEANSYNPGSARAYYEQNMSKWSPEVQRTLSGNFGGGGVMGGATAAGGGGGGAAPGGGAPLGGGAGGAIAGALGSSPLGSALANTSAISATGNPFDTIFGDGAKGNRFGFKPPKPITEMTVGEAIQYGKDVMIPATKGKIGRKDNLGTSAVGAYQFVSSTLPDVSKAVFGDKWETVPMTPENQDKMAEYLFNKNKNGNLQKTWEGLPKTAPGAYANLTWDQMRKEIFKHEIAIDLDRVNAGTPNPVRALGENLDTGQRQASRAGTGITNEYTAALSNGGTGLDVAQALAEKIDKKAPEGSAANVPGLVGLINEVREKGGKDAEGNLILNEAQAAALIESSIAPQSVWRNVGNALSNFNGIPFIDVVPKNNLFGSAVGAGMSVDQERLNEAIKDTVSPAVQTRIKTAKTDQISQERINAAEATVLALSAELMAAAKAAETKPGVVKAIPAMRKQLAEARELLADARQAQGKAREVTPPPPPKKKEPAVSMSGRIAGR